MEQFNLEKWLQDKSRKIVTRDGREIEILKTDFRGYKQIIGVIKNCDNKADEVEQWDGQENFRGMFGESKYDLFFADEEELTEFEKELEMMMVSFSNGNLGSDVRKEMPKEKLHNYAHRLLDLAREEILKSLPKWKKAAEDKEFDRNVLLFENKERVVLTTELYKGEYYIEADDLKTLPKECII